MTRGTLRTTKSLCKTSKDPFVAVWILWWIFHFRLCLFLPIYNLTAPILEKTVLITKLEYCFSKVHTWRGWFVSFYKLRKSWVLLGIWSNGVSNSMTQHAVTWTAVWRFQLIRRMSQLAGSSLGTTGTRQRSSCGSVALQRYILLPVRIYLCIIVRASPVYLTPWQVIPQSQNFILLMPPFPCSSSSWWWSSSAPGRTGLQSALECSHSVSAAICAPGQRGWETLKTSLQKQRAPTRMLSLVFYY